MEIKNLYSSLLLFSLLFSFQFASSLEHSPASSPAPLPADISSPPITSPPAPAPSDLSPIPTPSPSPEANVPPNDVVPVPEPSEASDVIENEEERKESSSGMSGGKKVGITFAVLIGAAVVGLGGFVYKKRRENTRRSSYGEAARSRGDIL